MLENERDKHRVYESAHSLDSLSRYSREGPESQNYMIQDMIIESWAIRFFFAYLCGNGKTGGLDSTVLWNDVDNLVGRSQIPIAYRADGASVPVHSIKLSSAWFQKCMLIRTDL